MRIFRWLTIGLLATLTLAGCASNEKLTSQQIMDRMKETREKTNIAYVVGQIVSTGGEREGNFRVEAWLAKTGQTDALGKPIAQSRVKVLEASRQELVGTELVNDGKTMWIYNPDQNKVITGNIQELKQGRVGAQDPTAQMMRMQEQLQQFLDGSDVEIVNENDKVADRPARQIKLKPKPETADQMQLGSLVETYLWVSHDDFIPLRARVNAGEMGTLDATVQQIERNGKLDPALFTFTPPAGAEVVDAAELAEKARPTTTNLEEARKTASFPVLTPAALPEGVTLDEVQKLAMGGEAVIQNYGGMIEFSLVQTKGERGFRDDDLPFGAKSTQVTVRGRQGTLITGSGPEPGTLLRFQENDVNIIIAGTLSPEQAQSIAESLK